MNVTDPSLSPATEALLKELQVRSVAHEDLQDLIAATLRELDQLLPLAGALVDTHQHGIGFLTVEARKVMDDLVRQERRDHVEHAKAGIKLTGATPAPGSITAYSVREEAQRDVDQLAEWLNHRMRTAGICLVRGQSYAGLGINDPHVARLAEYVAATTALPLLREVHTTVEDITTRTRRVVDGRDTKALPEPCPFCRHLTLVAYLAEGLIRCERDPHTGEYEPCICNDSYCHCKTGGRRRHEWHRDKGSQKWGWYGLRQDQNLANRQDLDKRTADTTS